MEIAKVKSISTKLSDFTYRDQDENSFISVVEWANGEGIDISIDNRQFSLAYDELDGINYLVQVLRYSDRIKLTSNC